MLAGVFGQQRLYLRAPPDEDASERAYEDFGDHRAADGVFYEVRRRGDGV